MLQTLPTYRLSPDRLQISDHRRRVTDGSPHQSSMPVDFHPYLLAASPPGFDLSFAFRQRVGLHGPIENDASPKVVKASPRSPRVLSPFREVPEPGNNCNCVQKSDFLSGRRLKCKSESCLNLTSNSDEEVEFCLKRNAISDSIIQKKSDIDTRPLPQKKKRVSFADDLGGELVQIRLLTNRSESPPLLHPEVFSSLHNSNTPNVTRLPPLKLNFTQPASEYVAFREKLEKNFVSLENVILKDYNLMGTIKVKNVGFHKKVNARYTVDNWKSQMDAPAKYVPTTDAGTSLPYDTFSFELQLADVMPKTSGLKSVQFAIHYEVNSQQYWDNNSGDNYKIVPADWSECEKEMQRNTTDRVVFGLGQTQEWSRFCGWNHLESDIPYW